jgi:predicted acyl esterase
LQKKFFGHFLKGEDTGWDRQPRVLLNVRHPGEKFVARAENEWPLARTRWTKFFLCPDGSLGPTPPASPADLSYDAQGDGVTFRTPPLEHKTEITGPMAAHLVISSSTDDADLFLVVRVFDPAGNEVTFQGALDPNTPIAQGWLRCSHRRLDPDKSLLYRPYHPHDQVEPLTSGERYPVEVEIVPSCIVVPAGYRIALTVRGKDYEYSGPLSDFARSFHYASRGVGPFTHSDVRTGQITLHLGEAYLLLPIIPSA